MLNETSECNRNRRLLIPDLVEEPPNYEMLDTVSHPGFFRFLGFMIAIAKAKATGEQP